MGRATIQGGLVEGKRDGSNVSFTSGCDDGVMRILLTLTPLLALGACAAAAPQWHGGLTGVDCSFTRSQQGRPYCNVHEPPPERPSYCTRSLGTIDCWSNPAALPGPPREVADQVRSLTGEQERRRTQALPLF